MRKTPYLPRCSWNMLQLRGLTLLISSRRNYVLCGDSVKARGSQRIFQSDTTQLLPCLSGLFPLSDLWYSSQSPSHRPSTPRLRELREVFSWSSSHWVLCRWLAGVYQRITTPLFLMVINCHMFFYPLSLLQDHYTTTMRECQVFIRIFIIFLYVSYLLFSAPHLIISPFSQMSRGVREVVPERLDVRI